MNPITDYDVAEAMQMCGGSFIAQLGKAWLLADAVNQDKLKAAFPEYWVTYSELAGMLRARRAEPQRA